MSNPSLNLTTVHILTLTNLIQDQALVPMRCTGPDKVIVYVVGT